MRKQLNAYTEGILTQTMERLENKQSMGALDGLGDLAGGISNGIGGIGEKLAGSLSFAKPKGATGGGGKAEAANGHAGATGGESRL